MARFLDCSFARPNAGTSNPIYFTANTYNPGPISQPADLAPIDRSTYPPVSASTCIPTYLSHCLPANPYLEWPTYWPADLPAHQQTHPPARGPIDLLAKSFSSIPAYLSSNIISGRGFWLGSCPSQNQRVLSGEGSVVQGLFQEGRGSVWRFCPI